jgi:twitching motility protein PilT
MDIKQLLESSLAEEASDLHLMPGQPPILRVHGDLIPLKNANRLDDPSIKQLIYSIMTPEQQKEFETKRVIEFALSIGKTGNFRTSVFHHMNGIAAAFRVIGDKIPTMDELGFPAALKALLSLSHGLILVSGATGSGKSTTLAAMIQQINATRAAHIITIEDPIEYIHTSKKSVINQLQVGRDTLDMDSALRASLRQDPDVILLGEMRDLETIRLALTAAETGHLVLSTLHANSAPLSINRIIDIFPPEEKPRVRNLLAETLQGVICQTLVKKVSGGRVAALEIMLANAPIRHQIRQDMASHMESTIQTSGDLGMCTFEQYATKLLNKGVITAATARSMSTKRGLFNE